MDFKKLEQIKTIKGNIRRYQYLLQTLEESANSIKDLKDSKRLSDKINRIFTQTNNEIKDLEKQRREIIMETMSLPEKERKILLLRYDAGMTWEEIASTCGCTARHVQRIVQMLKGAGVGKTCNSSSGGQG